MGALPKAGKSKQIQTAVRGAWNRRADMSADSCVQETGVENSMAL